jgi:hypothetical protein
MATTAIKIENKGIEFTSPFSNLEVAVEFRRLVEQGSLTGNFASSLYEGAKKFKKYTAGQLPWLHVLVAQHNGLETRPNSDGPALTGLVAIHTHLADCRKSKDDGGKGLLHPMVGLLVGEQNVVLKLCGPKSKKSGQVSVASDHKYGHGEFYGYIDEEGNFNSRGCPEAVIEILERVNQDPARVISEIGKESGRCCYCFAELTQVGSKIAGAGKTCAGNYGLEYPRAADIRRYVLDNPEVLEGSSDADKWEVPVS